jgi:hypothetical protein
MRRARARLHLSFHQPFRREGQHLAHKVGVGTLLDQINQHHPVVGHRRLRPKGSSPQLEP